MTTLKYICIIILTCSFYSSGQNLIQEKSPKKAAIYSTILPGMGQIYTDKYWKIPVIYSGIITSAYFINESHKNYILYKTTAINRINGDNSDNLQYSDTELITLKNYYRRNRDISYLSLMGIYLLNIMDAYIDAHLYKYDISDDVSLNIEPVFNKREIQLSFTLNL